MWDPVTYLAYADERTRPARDLLAAVDVADPAYVVDLGCGTGTSTAVLAARWPRAEILGLDSSPAMIEAAVADPAAPGVRYAVGDAAGWRPDRPVDVIFSNALFQWVPGHLDLFETWLAALAPGGRLAMQVPGNFDAATHALLRQVCGSPRWRDRLGVFAKRREAAHEPGEYVARLARPGRVVDVWETTYLHILDGEDPVLRWVSGTALRPVLAALDLEPAGRARRSSPSTARCYGRPTRPAPPAPFCRSGGSSSWWAIRDPVAARIGLVTSPYATMTRRSDVGETPRVVAPWSPNELVAVIIGTIYLVAGIVAGAVSLGATMAVSDDPGPGISPVRTMSYLALGVLLLVAAARGRAKGANSVLGAAYLLAGLVLPVLGESGCRLLTLNHPDCAIQLSTAALLLGFGRTQD